jgi:hypothetical protein
MRVDALKLGVSGVAFHGHTPLDAEILPSLTFALFGVQVTALFF